MKIQRCLYGLLALLMVAASCTDEEIYQSNKTSAGKLVQLNELSFCTLGPNKKEVALTRVSDNLSGVDNLMLFAFDENGTKEGSWDIPPLNIVADATANTDDGRRVYKLTASISITTGQKTFYAVANYNRYWENCLDDLEAVSNESDFKQHLFNINSFFKENQSLPTLTNETVLLLGSGEITVKEDPNNLGQGIVEGEIKVKRPVAQMTFKINNTYINQNTGNTCVFTPETYTVCNVAEQSPLIALNELILDTEKDNRTSFFDTKAYSIPTAVDGVSTFFFYIPENVQPQKTDVADYHQRDKWDGYGDDGKKKWLNAPQNSSYIVMTGRYIETDGSGAIVRQGSVSYTIHLGDFSTTDKLGDFSVRRNYRYTYTVEVQGVDKIVTEAEAEENDPDPEKQPGAEGDIIGYENAAQVFDLDCHYEQVYVEYDLTAIANSLGNNVGNEQIGNAFILKASTPYAPNAEFVRPYFQDPTGAEESTTAANMDYKWIYFLSQTVQGSLSAYPGDQCKDQLADSPFYGKQKYLINPYQLCVSLGQLTRMIVDKETDTEIKEKAKDLHINLQTNNDHYVARFTAFIDEYYYQKNPLTDVFVGWDSYTRQDDRSMLIASNIEISPDGNSTYATTRTAFIQRAIQTYYNESAAGTTNAMGVETYCENKAMGGLGNFNASGGKSSTDGRENMKGLINYTSLLTWSTYIQTAKNGYFYSNTPQYMDHKIADILTSSYSSSPYYACLSRNRDLNGNGKIDDNEIRWYLPASDQYLRINIGSDAMSDASRLFLGNRARLTDYPAGTNDELYEAGSIYYTSTYNSGLTNEPGIKQVLWAAEVGALGNNGAGHSKGLVRCIRNLPSTKIVTDNSDEIVVDDRAMGDVSYTLREKNGMFIFDFGNLLDERIYREEQEDPYPHHYEEPSEKLMEDANRLPKGIVVAPYNVGNVGGKLSTSYSADDRDRIISGGLNPCANFSVSGDEANYGKWRVPNLREMMVITTQAEQLGFFERGNLGTYQTKYIYDEEVSYWRNVSDYFDEKNNRLRIYFFMTSTDFSGHSNQRPGYVFQAYRNGHRSGFITTESSGPFFVRCVRDMTEADK